MCRVRTGSGATSVQIVHKRGRRVLSMEHVGSAHDEVNLALLLQVAHERMHAGQDELPLGQDHAGGRPTSGPVVTATPSLVLWEALERGPIPVIEANLSSRGFTCPGTRGTRLRRRPSGVTSN